MRTVRNSKLRVETLETRLTPAAAVSFLNGNLTVTADNTNTSVILDAPAGSNNISVYVASNRPTGLGVNTDIGQYRVDPDTFTAGFKVAANFKGTYRVTGNITLNGGNGSDLLSVQIQDNAVLAGNLTVNGGNGTDNIYIDNFSQATAAQGKVSGILSINGGLGADSIRLFGISGTTQVLVNGGGGGTRADLGFPQNNDLFQIYASSLSGNVNVTNAVTSLNDYFVGTAVNSTGNTISGSLTVSNTVAAPLDSWDVAFSASYDSDLPGNPVSYSSLVMVDFASVVNGGVTFVGSSSAEGLFILGKVNGSVNYVPGAGNNDFVIGNAGSATIGGSAQFTGGAGTDRFVITAGSVVNGNLAINTGNGSSFFGLNTAFFVFGSLSVTTGSGDDAIGTVLGTVNGNASFNLGNGNNSLVWSGTGGGSTFTYTGGSGTDALTINGLNAFALSVSLGAGADTFTYGAATTVASATIDFGIDADLDIYVDGGNVITWNQTLVNL